MNVRTITSGTLAALLGLACGGCAMRVGPKTVARDRFDYGGAIARSWKEQMLLNMVKVRYVEPPIFLDIAQVVAQYTFEGTANLNAPDWVGDPSGSVASIGGRWAESPTITYNPMSGERFTKSLLSPIPPVSLLSLVQAGWPVDAVFSIGLRSINGLHATSRVALGRHTADSDFYRLLRLLRELQLSEVFGLRVIRVQAMRRRTTRRERKAPRTRWRRYASGISYRGCRSGIDRKGPGS